MAMLEDLNVCSICERHVSGYAGGVPVYFCPHCFALFRTEIMARELWVRGMLGPEKARRKRRDRLMKSVGLPTFTDNYQGMVL